MKQVHYYIYGLLTGSVLILSTILMVQSFNDARAQSSASGTQNVAMVTGQYQNSESILYVVVPNPDNGEPVLLSYTSPNYQLSLVGARNLRYDRRVIDAAFGRPQRSQGGKTFPPVSEMKENYRSGQNQSGQGQGQGQGQVR